MDDKLKAMKVSGKVIAVIMKIGYIAATILMAACGVFLVFMAFSGGATSIVTSGGMNILITDGAGASPQAVAAACYGGLITGGFLLAIFMLAYRVFSQINASGMIFDAKHVKPIKIVGILVAAMPVVGGVVDLIAAPYLGGESLNLGANSLGVAGGAVIYCLANIYDYACATQKQAGGAAY